MALEQETIYIKGNQNVEVAWERISLGDVLEISCSNPHVLAKVKSLRILQITDKNKQRHVISILKIINTIQKEYPNVEIKNLGSPDIIVSYERCENQNVIWEWIKVASVVIITFVGSAFSIMTFNNDVDVPKLFSQVYELVMGKPKTGFSVLEIAYSIGITLGIVIFFNHFGKKRFSVDPTPIEVEMRSYEDEIQNALIQKYEREGDEIDVD